MQPASERNYFQSVWAVLAITGLTVSIVYALADRLVEDVLEIETLWGQVGEIASMTIVTSLVLWLSVLRPLHQSMMTERAEAQANQLEISQNATQQEFDSRFHRALEMTSTEEMAYRSTERALSAGLTELDVTMLLADSSEAHLNHAVDLGSGPFAGGCGIVNPQDCPAIRRSQTLIFTSSDDIDACPQLDQRSTGACAAVCVPVSVGGRSIGVIHAASSVDTPPTELDVRRIQTVATQSGSRIGMLRVMAATTLQAATDPLTGMLNRRSVENEALALIRQGRQFSVAMGDLDHFKRLNDQHGHDAGDRALRLFSRVMRASLRSSDILSRYGGEEFVVVFPDLPIEEAAAALERVQHDLLTALASGTVPGFTVSFGLAESDQATYFDELCQIADEALYRAKDEGRDKVVWDTAPVPLAPELTTISV